MVPLVIDCTFILRYEYSSYYAVLLHAGGEGVHFRLLYAQRILEHHPWQWWVGGKESHSKLGEPWILAV